ncbi:hypothetical protein DFP72DRAFT_1079815 [Ephemerocybe angulata]|uniref:Calpain catalytic domain-containing protein n=1 Tax=Ephemerocybe angulata TaxID=980116 RepID=A0A8H6HCI5_9AGAR|nr:hypothetical protein DFP72DRAFT_1079815 [Tulosesus angulatus]
MIGQYKRPTNKDPKKQEERKGRLVVPNVLKGDNNKGGRKMKESADLVVHTERSRSRSRLRSAGNRSKGKKDKKQPSVGLFVTKELNVAIETTKATVERIAKEYKAANRKYRDTAFDLEYDTGRCLNGHKGNVEVVAKDIHRVTEIFDKPVFFPEGGAASSTAIRQGGLGDCYFLSALATVSGLPGLIEKICVARSEEVGIYGFIFYQDQGWVGVIVDDLLFTNIPKYEHLDQATKQIYHEDKDRFEAIARKGGRLLTYAKAGTSDETWVSLIEKAYAKLYGCFAHINSGGQTGEAIEDLTGGVAINLNSRDILDVDRFWQDELCKVNKDRFGHAYAVLRAVEVMGKRFVVVRNPWGLGEWTGPWSDGSKEWTAEWLKCLPQLNHVFGNDGQFVMEYKDFLRYFTDIDRVRLFDDGWTVASCWLDVPVLPIPSAPSYGILSFQIAIPKKANTILVLSQLNDRSFESIKKKIHPSFAFSVVKLGESTPLATGAQARPFWDRSGTLELELEAGNYVVYVQLDHTRPDHVRTFAPLKVNGTLSDTTPILTGGWLAHDFEDLTSKVQAISLSQNWDGVGETDYLVKSLEDVIREDLEETKSAESDEETDTDSDGASDLESDKESSGAEDEPKKKTDDSAESELKPVDLKDSLTEGKKEPTGDVVGEVTLAVPDGNENKSDDDDVDDEWRRLLEDDGLHATLGLKVYTQTKVPARVTGRIKSADGKWEW